MKRIIWLVSWWKKEYEPKRQIENASKRRKILKENKLKKKKKKNYRIDLAWLTDEAIWVVGPFGTGPETPFCE